MPAILVDADACPVKQEVYRVARRHRLPVVLVANSWMHTPAADGIELVVVDGGLDAADDWIVEHAREGDVVVTADIPLASRCLKQRSQVLGPSGKKFTEDMIGDALATRDILADLREAGTVTGGPAPFQKKDRSRFLHTLDEMVRRALRP